MHLLIFGILEFLSTIFCLIYFFSCFVNFCIHENIRSCKKKEKKNWKLYKRHRASTYYTSFPPLFCSHSFLFHRWNATTTRWRDPTSLNLPSSSLKIILGGAGSFLSFFCLGYVAKLSSQLYKGWKSWRFLSILDPCKPYTTDPTKLFLEKHLISWLRKLKRSLVRLFLRIKIHFNLQIFYNCFRFFNLVIFIVLSQFFSNHFSRDFPSSKRKIL